jgi:molecular chaperone GrpE
VLADFRHWLQSAASGAAELPPEDGREPIDLHTLLGQMTALRHEVNLQTKAVRAQQEQNAETLRQLGQAVEEARQSRTALRPHEDKGDEALRPLLKTLVDLADVLGLSRREVARVQSRLAEYLQRLAAEPAGQARPSFWQRWFGQTTPTPEPQGREVAALVEQFVASVVTGYTMSLQRVERALAQHSLEPIPCEGLPFDPERMEVVEAVADSGRPPGEVIEVVRPGYLWRGRVFRYAQVRVARS